MDIGPILASMRHNKAGATLIVLQIALTLAVLSNALFIIQQQTKLSRRPSGISDEADVFVISNRWAGGGSDLASREETDLLALRALPQVIDATVSYDYPLGEPYMGMTITLDPDRRGSGVGAMVYPADEHAINTFGLQLVAGRNFHADEIVNLHGLADRASTLGGMIVTKAVARQLVPDGKVLGRVATILPGLTTVPIIGVVARLQSSSEFGRLSEAESSVLLPYRYIDSQIFYIVRAKPGLVSAAMAAARNRLFEISRQRIVGVIQTLAKARNSSYRGARGVARVMDVVCAILLAVTALGIVGLTSYWVSQRQHMIGIRRSLGATRAKILGYFQVENLLISAMGCVIGAGFAIAANLWLLQIISFAKLPTQYLVVSVGAMLLLGQLAILWPAIRAASIPPVAAARL